MSKINKRKHVIQKTTEDLSLPTGSQYIVKVVHNRGNNLHEVENTSGERFLVSMPTKFRRNIWIKSGGFVVVEPIAEGNKVKGEIVKILLESHIKWYKAQNYWPREFDECQDKDSQETNGVKKEDSEEDGLFVNTNRRPMTTFLTDESSSEDESS